MLDIIKMAGEIIKSNRFLSLATSNKEGNVWCTPLSYCFDEDCNFYFTTTLDSKHIENIRDNPYVAFSIFDSTRRVSDIDGLQVAGIVGEVERGKLPEVVDKYYKYVFPDSNERAEWAAPCEYFTQNEYPIYRFFQIMPINVQKRDTENLDVDRTVEINIELLKKELNDGI